MMKGSPYVVVVVLAATLGGAVHAQNVTVGLAGPVCDAGDHPVVDTASVAVVIGPAKRWNQYEYTDDDRHQLLFYADAIRRRFTAPSSLGGVPILVETPIPGWGGDTSLFSAVGGKLVLVMSDRGRVRDKFWQVVPFSATFAQAVVAAVVAADTSRDFEGMQLTGGRGAFSDTLVLQIRGVESPSPTELPMMRAQLSRYRPEAYSRTLRQGAMVYPRGAGRSNVENKGQMQVVVGSDGKAVMPLSQITRIDWRDFVSTMRSAVETSVFTPARSGGCAVPSISIHSFTFDIEKP
jgi:hypothetical protein